MRDICKNTRAQEYIDRGRGMDAAFLLQTHTHRGGADAAHLLAVAEALVAVGLDRREVDEDIFAAIGWSDEAEALIGEKLDLSLVSHDTK